MGGASTLWKASSKRPKRKPRSPVEGRQKPSALCGCPKSQTRKRSQLADAAATWRGPRASDVVDRGAAPCSQPTNQRNQEFQGVDSVRFLILRCGIPRSIGNFPEIQTQRFNSLRTDGTDPSPEAGRLGVRGPGSCLFLLTRAPCPVAKLRAPSNPLPRARAEGGCSWRRRGRLAWGSGAPCVSLAAKVSRFGGGTKALVSEILLVRRK